MNYSKLMDLASNRDWDSIKNDLGFALKKTPDNPELLCLSAHFAMRQGQLSTAQWLINKSIALDAEYQPAFAELTLLKFIHNDQTFFLHGLSSDLLICVPENHPLHLLNIFSLIINEKGSHLDLDRFPVLSSFKDELSDFIEFNRNTQFEVRILTHNHVGAKTFKLIHALIHQKDFLLAHILSQCVGLLSPLNPDIFAASGLSYLALNKLELAGLQLSEALFRGTSFEKEVLQKLFIVNARQRRFHEAIATGLMLDKAGELKPFQELMLVDMYMQLRMRKKEVEKRLERLSLSIGPGEEYFPYLDTLRQKNNYLGKKERGRDVIGYLKNKTDASDCKAAYLYFYAELLRSTDPEEAKRIAKRALQSNPFHIDASLWSDGGPSQDTSIEFLSLFVSREGEGKVWPSASEEALIRLITDTEGSPQKLWDRFQKDFPLENLTAGAYRLLPALHKRLASHNMSPPIIKGVWKKSFLENSSRLSLALPFFDALDRENIRFVLLKGVANALTLYADMGSRAMSDIDVFIDQDNIGKVHDMLVGLGWHTKDIPNPPRLRFQYASTYKHPQGGNLDLHWRLSEDFTCDYFDLKDFMPLDKLALHGRSWAILSPSVNLMLTVLHGVAWNHLSPSRWVVDTKLILDRDPKKIDWLRILKLTEKYHCQPPLVAGLKYFFNLYPHIKPPKSLEDFIERHEGESPLLRIRFRSRSHTSTFEEALATYLSWQKKFVLSKEDVLIICGSDKEGHIPKKCQERNILWAPHFEPDTIIKNLSKSAAPPQNLIAVDANYSCLMRFYCQF